MPKTILIEKRIEVIRTIREMFWEFEDAKSEDFSPRILRNFFSNQAGLTSEEVGEFCLFINDGHSLAFWERIENLLGYIKAKRKYFKNNSDRMK
jgi:hypothetical protein